MASKFVVASPKRYAPLVLTLARTSYDIYTQEPMMPGEVARRPETKTEQKHSTASTHVSRAHLDTKKRKISIASPPKEEKKNKMAHTPAKEVQVPWTIKYVPIFWPHTDYVRQLPVLRYKDKQVRSTVAHTLPSPINVYNTRYPMALNLTTWFASPSPPALRFVETPTKYDFVGVISHMVPYHVYLGLVFQAGSAHCDIWVAYNVVVRAALSDLLLISAHHTETFTEPTKPPFIADFSSSSLPLLDASTLSHIRKDVLTFLVK